MKDLAASEVLVIMLKWWRFVTILYDSRIIYISFS